MKRAGWSEKILSVLCAGALVVGCATTEKRSVEREVAEIVSLYQEVIPYINDEDGFSNTHNQKYLKTRMNQIDQGVRSLLRYYKYNRDVSDPAILGALQRMHHSVNEAQNSFFINGYEYSQTQMRASLKELVRLNSYIDSVAIYKTDESTARPAVFGSNLSYEQGIDGLVATRQYSEALKHIESALKNVDKIEQQSELLERAMVISLRYMDSPATALHFVKRVEAYPSLEQHRSTLKKWANSLESMRGLSLIDKQLPAALMQPSDFPSAVYAIDKLHVELSKSKDPKQRAQNAYMLGNLYARFGSVDERQAPRQYYESCIETLPHTSLSEQCYFALEAGVKQQHGIAMGKPLPEKERLHLVRMKYLTKVYYSSRVGSVSNNLDYK